MCGAIPLFPPQVSIVWKRTRLSLPSSQFTSSVIINFTTNFVVRKFCLFETDPFGVGGGSTPLSAFLLTPLFPTLTEFVWRVFRTLALSTEGTVCPLQHPQHATFLPFLTLSSKHWKSVFKQAKSLSFLSQFSFIIMAYIEL